MRLMPSNGLYYQTSYSAMRLYCRTSYPTMELMLGNGLKTSVRLMIGICNFV